MPRVEQVYLDVARWMKQQREKHGFAQSDISRLLGYARPTFHLIEKGEQRIHLHTYEAIRNLLDDGKVEDTRRRIEALRQKPVVAPFPEPEAPENGTIAWDAFKVGQRLRPEYEGGAKIADLAKTYGFSRRHIIYALSVAGVDLRRFQTPPKATLHRDGEIVRLYTSGREMKDIADVYGITHERVRQIVVRSGVPRDARFRKPLRKQDDGQD